MINGWIAVGIPFGGNHILGHLATRSIILLIKIAQTPIAIVASKKIAQVP